MRTREFWARLDELAAGSELVIDRPAGSAHPRFPELVYPLDYGYLAGTVSGDGSGIDAWRGSLPAPRVTGVVITVDTLKRDAEVKLLLGCTPAEAARIEALHTSGAQAGLLVLRDLPG